jgi:hypothetical protein
MPMNRKRLRSEGQIPGSAGIRLARRHGVMEAVAQPRLRTKTGKAERQVFRIRSPRPTILDRRLRGDAWVIQNDADTSGVYFGNYCLSSIPSVSFDLPTFNRLLDNILIHRR